VRPKASYVDWLNLPHFDHNTVAGDFEMTGSRPNYRCPEERNWEKKICIEKIIKNAINKIKAVIHKSRACKRGKRTISTKTILQNLQSKQAAYIEKLILALR